MTIKFVDEELTMAYLIVGWLWWRRQALVELNDETKQWCFALSNTEIPINSPLWNKLNASQLRARTRQQHELDWQPITQKRRLR